MAKHQLIISNGPFPVLSDETAQHKDVRTLVVNWKGTWEPRDHPERCLVVAPGDELELVLAPEMRKGGSLWIFREGLPLLEAAEGIERQDSCERVDLESGSRVVRVNPALAEAAGESRYTVFATELGEWPEPPVGEGNPGTLTASKP